MRFLDSIDECTTGDLAESLERDLRELKKVRVTGTAWLAREDFRTWLDPILVNLETSGVRIVFDPARAESTERAQGTVKRGETEKPRP